MLHRSLALLAVETLLSAAFCQTFDSAAIPKNIKPVLTQSPARKSDGISDAAILKEVPHARMRSILQGMGIEFTEKPSGDSCVFAIQFEGARITLLNQVTDVELFAGLPDNTDMTRVKQWNAEHRSGRAYFEAGGGSFLESRMDFGGGVTRQKIEAFIRQFRTTLADCTSFVTDPQSNPLFEAPVAPQILATKEPSPPPPAEQSDPPPAGALAANVPPAGAPPPEVHSFYKSSSAHKPIKTAAGNFVMWVDEAAWKYRTEKAGVLRFTGINGAAGAKVVSTGIAVTTDRLRDIALENARKVDPDAEIVSEQPRIVNGREILALQITARVNGNPFRYFGYYHGGTSGTIQAVVFSLESAFEENLAAFTDFLNGLEILDEDLRPASSGSPLLER